MSSSQRRSKTTNASQRLYPSLSGAETSSSGSDTSDGYSTDETPETIHSTTNRSFTKRRQKITKEVLEHITQSPRPRSRSKPRVKPTASTSWADNFQELYSQIMKTYSENVGEPLYYFWRNLKPFQKTGLILLLLLSFSTFTILSISLLTSHKKVPKIADFLVDAGAVTRDHFKSSNKIGALLRYFGNLLLNNEPNKSPVTLLLVGKENETGHFLTHLKDLVKRHELKLEFMDYSISSESPPSRRELETALFEHLKQSRLLILRGIDHLRSTAPLVLQSITDPESSPFKNTLILATLSPGLGMENGKEGGGYLKKCDERVVSHLLEQWSPGLTPDKRKYSKPSKMSSNESEQEKFNCTSSTQLSRSTISFDEEQEEEPMETVSYSGKYISVFAIVSILVVACFLAFILRRNSDGDRLLQTYCQRAEETAQDFFGGSRKISSLFCYAGRFLLTDKSKCCETQRPLVLLLTLNRKLGPGPLDYTVSALKPPSRRELEAIVFSHLKSNRILILRGIDRLKSTAPLTEEESESSVKRCDEKIFGYLLRRWSSDQMKPDSVIPIISRISANSHCFE
uniref:Uncharacterized protein n=1 Tax=Ditylenchus dipsaci TaxID=166011 RepID=A0A915CQ36_9BILA